jgi:hypothetical protein
VAERHAAGESITKELYASVGKEFGVSRTVANEMCSATAKAILEVEIFNFAAKVIE